MGGGASQSSAQYNPNLSSASYRSHAPNARAEQTMFASPTESEFSETYDAPDAIR
jgi:mitogen-activated protein kinase kinase kinase